MADQHPKGPIEKISQKKSGGAEEIREQHQKIIDDIGKSRKISKEEPKSPDAYKRDGVIQKFMTRTSQMMNRASSAHHIRLAGSRYPIQDNRTKPPPEPGRDEGATEESKKRQKQFSVREGKLEETREKTYKNYLSEPKMPVPKAPTNVRESIKRILSKFEDMILQRFENGKKIVVLLKGKESQFGKKKGSDWNSFFSKFSHRTVQRNKSLVSIKSFVFRGLVKEGGKAGKGVLISDLVSTHTEKFARFSIPLSKAAQFAKMQPGARFSASIVSEIIGGDTISYFAISSGAAYVVAMSPREKQGQFMSQRSETIAAERLGITLDRRLSEKANLLNQQRHEKKQDQLKEKKWFIPAVIVVAVLLVIWGFVSGF